jgi:hypothetical protein
MTRKVQDALIEYAKVLRHPNTFALGAQFERIVGHTSATLNVERSLRRIVLAELRRRDPTGALYVGVGGWRKLQNPGLGLERPQLQGNSDGLGEHAPRPEKAIAPH